MSSPFVLIAPQGMLGRAVEARLKHFALPYTALGPVELDLTKPATIAEHIHPGVRFVINCAAWTDVDGAEANEPEATAVNATGVRALADRCADVGAVLVTYSTDYVFNGVADRPYPVQGARAPINAYGRSKARGEELLESSAARWVNIRTSWLYAPWGKNFVRTIAGAAKTRPVLRVVNDQRGRPTSAEHLAEMTLGLIDRGVTGHVHVTDGLSAGPGCTWFDFASEIVRLAGLGASCRVEPCTSEEFPRPARRPPYSVLDLAESERLLGPMPDWRENLASVMKRLEG